MDRNARLAHVGIDGRSQVRMQGASKAQSVSPRICEEPRKVRVPGSLGAYESGEENLLKEPAGGKHKSSRFVDAGVQRFRRVCAL